MGGIKGNNLWNLNGSARCADKIVINIVYVDFRIIEEL